MSRMDRVDDARRERGLEAPVEGHSVSEDQGAMDDRRPVHEAGSYFHSSGQEPKMPITMPGSPAQAAEEIRQVGVEGVPADAKAGPRLLAWELVLMVAVLIAASLAAYWWLGWAFGVGVFAFFVIACMVNPVFWATITRARDRAIVVRRHEDEIKHVGGGSNVVPH